jgi:hypothetical protein
MKGIGTYTLGCPHHVDIVCRLKHISCTRHFGNCFYYLASCSDHEYGLRTIEHWDCRFESHSWHGYMSAFFCIVFSCVGETSDPFKKSCYTSKIFTALQLIRIGIRQSASFLKAECYATVWKVLNFIILKFVFCLLFLFMSAEIKRGTLSIRT